VTTRLENYPRLLRELRDVLREFEETCIRFLEGKRTTLEDIRKFVEERRAILARVATRVEKLKRYEELLETTKESDLLSLQEEILGLRRRCNRVNEQCIEKLKQRRAAIAVKLKALTHAGKALRGYGKRPPPPPRFLDSIN